MWFLLFAAWVIFVIVEIIFPIMFVGSVYVAYSLVCMTIGKIFFPIFYTGFPIIAAYILIRSVNLSSSNIFRLFLNIATLLAITFVLYFTNWYLISISVIVLINFLISLRYDNDDYGYRWYYDDYIFLPCIVIGTFSMFYIFAELWLVQKSLFF